LVNARESRSLEIETALKKASNDSAKRALDAKLGAQKKAQDIILTGDSEARACKESAQRNMQSAVDLIVSRF
jgi:vacuolar-type H+-ATPase subunit H